MEERSTPGSRIRALRLRTGGLSAQKVADDVGISRTHLTMMENDNDLPGRETLAAIADYFGVTVDHILNGSDTPPQPPSLGEFVDDPDELALLGFWRGLLPTERGLMLKMLNPKG